MRRPLAILPLLVCAACAEGAGHSSLPAVPIKSACSAKTAGPGSVGFDVRIGRRHSEAQTIFITNLTDERHAVRIEQVSRVEGPCAGDWARQTQLDYVDAVTCEPPAATTLGSKQFQRLEIGAQRVHATWGCTKMGIAVTMKIDDQVICADAGSAIATAEHDDE
jgi:hypothetical protein